MKAEEEEKPKEWFTTDSREWQVSKHIDTLLPVDIETDGAPRPCAASMTINLVNIQQPEYISDPIFLDTLFRTICRHVNSTIFHQCIMPNMNEDGGFSLSYLTDTAHIYMATYPLIDYATFLIHDSRQVILNHEFFEIFDFLVKTLKAEYSARHISISQHGLPRGWEDSADI